MPPIDINIENPLLARLVAAAVKIAPAILFVAKLPILLEVTAWCTVLALGCFGLAITPEALFRRAHGGQVNLIGIKFFGGVRTLVVIRMAHWLAWCCQTMAALMRGFSPARSAGAR